MNNLLCFDYKAIYFEPLCVCEFLKQTSDFYTKKQAVSLFSPYSNFWFYQSFYFLRKKKRKKQGTAKNARFTVFIFGNY